MAAGPNPLLFSEMYAMKHIFQTDSASKAVPSPQSRSVEREKVKVNLLSSNMAKKYHPSINDVPMRRKKNSFL